MVYDHGAPLQVTDEQPATDTLRGQRQYQEGEVGGDKQPAIDILRGQKQYQEGEAGGGGAGRGSHCGG